MIPNFPSIQKDNTLSQKKNDDINMDSTIVVSMNARSELMLRKVCFL